MLWRAELPLNMSTYPQTDKGTRLDSSHKQLCHRIKEIITGLLKYSHCSRKKKILHFEESPNLGPRTAVSMVIETKVVIG